MNIKSALNKINPFSSSSKNLDYGEFYTNYVLGINDMAALGWFEIRAMMAWQYYKKISPLFRAVNLVANEFASGVKPVLFDKKTGIYIREYDPSIKASVILELLKKPNFNMTGSQFKRALCTSQMVTGDCYLIVTGLNEPIEIYYENPKFITIQGGKDGYPEQYIVSKANGSDIFKRTEINGVNRFISQDGLREIYQIRDFNPDYQNGNFTGFSRISPIYYEIEQYLNSNIHNLSQLKKGARPSGVLLYEGDLTDEQRTALRAEIRRYYQGAENAGEMLIMESGVKKEFKELSINNKDMDFVQLKKMVKDGIYENLEIPASFYDNSKSTMGNKDTDKMNIYDFNVLPMTKQIFEGIGTVCLRRYKDGDRYELTYIEEEIPALKDRFIAQLKDKRESGCFTTNEIRAMYGAESIGESGDTIYQPMNLIAIGTDKFTADNPIKPVVVKQASLPLIRKELENKGISEEKINEIMNHYILTVDGV